MYRPVQTFLYVAWPRRCSSSAGVGAHAARFGYLYVRDPGRTRVTRSRSTVGTGARDPLLRRRPRRDARRAARRRIGGCSRSSLLRVRRLDADVSARAAAERGATPVAEGVDEHRARRPGERMQGVSTAVPSPDDPTIIGNVYDKYGTEKPCRRARSCAASSRAVSASFYANNARRARVLEVGCGEGRLAQHLVTEAHRPEVFDACDLALGKVAPGLDAIIELRKASIYALPFEDASFDLVVCCEVLEHLDDPARGLREVARVARSRRAASGRRRASPSGARSTCCAASTSALWATRRATCSTSAVEVCERSSRRTSASSTFALRFRGRCSWRRLARRRSRADAGRPGRARVVPLVAIMAPGVRLASARARAP